MKLNDLAFINEPLEEYLLDNYEGEVDFRLDSSYYIDRADIQELSLASDEYSIAALYTASLSSIASDTIILYCHGQSLHMDFYWPRAKLLAKDYPVLMFDYRGYGLSTGSPSEEGLYADIRAAFQWLIDNGADANNIIAYGFSLGSAPATDLIAYGHEGLKPSKLILESPFASTDFITQESTIIDVSASYITSLKFDNAEKIKVVEEPLLWMHGTDDDYVAMSNGEAIIQNYQGSYLEPIRVEGGMHGDNGVPETMGFEAYRHSIQEFIRR
jgi:fermentation-respiration switch protein FrsA (DUF1100 family)